MIDPVSVLLIVGAAVIGPIKALPPRRIETPGTYSYCVREHGGIQEIDPQRHIEVCIPLPREPSTDWETFPEVCARAMREIGAVWYEAGPTVGDGQYNWFIYRTPLWQGKRVLCVPTPSGL